MSEKRRNNEPEGLLGEDDQGWSQPPYFPQGSSPMSEEGQKTTPIVPAAQESSHVPDKRQGTEKLNSKHWKRVLLAGAACASAVVGVYMGAAAGKYYSEGSNETQAQRTAAALLDTCYDSPPSPLDNVIDKSNKTVFIMGASRETVVRGTAAVDTLVACGAAQNIQIEPGAKVGMIVLSPDTHLLVGGRVDDVYTAGDEQKNVAVVPGGSVENTTHSSW